MADLHIPSRGPVAGLSPVDRFLVDLSVAQWHARDHGRVISRIDLTPTHASVRISGDDESRAQQFGPFPLDSDREAMVEGLLRPAGLPIPQTWEVMEVMGTIVYGTERPWQEHWAMVLLDVGQYGAALREEPYGLRYERIELVRRPIPSQTDGEAAIVVVDAERLGPRATTLVPIPVPLPQLEQVVGIGYAIREWIRQGEGQYLEDGSRVKRLGRDDLA